MQLVCILLDKVALAIGFAFCTSCIFVWILLGIRTPLSDNYKRSQGNESIIKSKTG